MVSRATIEGCEMCWPSPFEYARPPREARTYAQDAELAADAAPEPLVAVDRAPRDHLDRIHLIALSRSDDPRERALAQDLFDPVLLRVEAHAVDRFDETVVAVGRRPTGVGQDRANGDLGVSGGRLNFNVRARAT